MRKAFLFILTCVVSLQLQQAQVNPKNTQLYDDSSVARVDIYINNDSLKAMYDKPSSDHEYKVVFVFRNHHQMDSLQDVGFRFRGNTSRRSDKKSFKVSFNSFVKGRKYAGVEKMNLNGEHNDPSIIRSKLVWDLFNKIDVPSVRANHVEVYINKSYYGLYINVEHVDENFLKSRFDNNNGNLYKCLSPANLKYINSDPESYKKLMSNGIQVYELKTNEKTADYTDLAHFIEILNKTSDQHFSSELDKVFNVDNYLRTIVVEILTGHWDNYIFNNNNFYLYQNIDNHKFEYIPYDVDNTFGIDWFGVDWSKRNIYKWSNGSSPLFDRIMKVPDYRNRYTGYMKAFIESNFNTAKLFPEMDARLALISNFAERDSFRTLDYNWNFNDFLKSYNESLGQHVKTGIKPYIETRSQSALNQLLYTSETEIANCAVISIYPNPFQESITIMFNESYNSLKLNIYDISGKLVYVKDIKNENQVCWNGTAMSGNKLSNGIYFIEVKDDSNTSVFKSKVILQR